MPWMLEPRADAMVATGWAGEMRYVHLAARHRPWLSRLPSISARRGRFAVSPKSACRLPIAC